MKKHGLKILAIIIVIILWICVLALGRSRYEYNGNFSGTVNVDGVATITGIADG